MAEKVKLAVQSTETADSLDPSRCIMCQNVSSERTSSTENGRKRILEAAAIRNDFVSKRLKLMNNDNFVYHMNNECYKKYTLKKSLDRILVGNSDPGHSSRSGEHTSTRTVRSKSTPRCRPSLPCAVYKKKCVVCGQVNHQGNFDKYRISETARAEKFLEATVFLQDEVYTRTCDLEDINSVFGADLYCHKLCINQYLLKYKRACCEKPKQKSCKQVVWSEVVKHIEIGLSSHEGYELTYVRDCMNEKIGSNAKVSSKEVKLLLTNHFGNKIRFSQPKQVNRSVLFFSSDVTTETMAETIRATDPIRQCAEMIRQSLLEVDFDLQDRFCDAGDLKRSMKSTEIPDPLLKFLGYLFHFDVSTFNACSMNEELLAVREDEIVSTDDTPGISVSRVRQMQGLFQIMYYDLFRGRKKTPLHIMNSQAIYDSCKSASLITSFNRFGLCSSYDELMRHHNDMALYTVESGHETVPFPSHFEKSMYTIAAFDNFDHDESTLSGMGGSHDTVTVLFQEAGSLTPTKPRLGETSIHHGPKAFHANLPCQELKPFFKPSKKPDLSDEYKVSNSHPVKHDLLNEVRVKDTAWLLARLDLGERESQKVTVKPPDQKMPIWSATNSVLTDEDIPVKRVGFLPVLPHPVTQYDAVYTAMKNLQGILEYLDQSFLPVTCDEGVYRIAREIQLIRPMEFKKIVLCMGSFHMAKVALGCLGKNLKGSGAEIILTESSVFGPNVVESVLNGKNYVRSLKGLQLLKEAFSRLQWAEFLRQNGKMQKYKSQLDILVEMRTKVAEKSHTESSSLLWGFQDTCNELMHDFDQFVLTNCQQSETYQYWNTFIHLMQNVQNLIRSDREGDWNLHLQAIQSLLPIFAAFDSTNYLRWCSLYFEDMQRLPETAPEVYQAFADGKFIVKRTEGRFKAVGADMALEQTINKSQKSSAGIIGSSRKKQYVARWELIYHEMLAITNLFRELSGVNSTSYDLDVNRSFNKATTKLEEKNIQSILAVIEKTENPFHVPTTETKLHNIQTREIMDENIRKQLLHVEGTGSAAYEKLRRERFIDKTVRFSETIHRTNLQTFASIHKPKVSKKSSLSSKKKDGQMQRVLEVARARGKSMEELLQYDVASTSQLFDEDDFMTKSTKSSIVLELEQKLEKDDSRTPQMTDQYKTSYILDVMAAIRKIGTKNHLNFGNLCDAVLRYVQTSAKNAKRIDLIFDSYLKRTIKDSERQRRKMKSPIELQDISRETPLPIEMDRFWPSGKNKLRLQKLLHQETLRQAHSLFPNVEVVVSHFTGDTETPCMSTMSGLSKEVTELNLDIEEADSRTIPHAMHIVKHNLNRIVVLSSDTDITVMMIYYWNQLHTYGLQELWVKAGVGDSTRLIPIHALVMRIGNDLSHVLPAVHTLTGCDYTSKVGTKHAALRASPEIFLKHFGTLSVDMESEFAAAEEYLTQVLKKGTSCRTTDELRCLLYHQSKRMSYEQLPPTSCSLREHIRRAFYVTNEMISLLSSPSKPLDPTQYGFEDVDEVLVPILGKNPIPEEMAVCCTCVKCASERCKCRREGIPCCRFCKCESGSEPGSRCMNL